MEEIKAKIILTPEQFELFEEQASKLIFDGKSYYFLPYWLERTEEGSMEFTMHHIDRLPDDVLGNLIAFNEYYEKMKDPIQNPLTDEESYQSLTED